MSMAVTHIDLFDTGWEVFDACEIVHYSSLNAECQ